MRGLDDIRACLDASEWREHEPIRVAGQELRLTAEPRDSASLASLVASLAAHGRAALVRGGGTRIGLGNPLRAVDLMISTCGLAGIRHYEADDGVVEVGAGTLIGELREAVVSGGWELPLDCPADGATVGGTIATAWTGPRTLGFGPVRRSVLGLEVVLGSGERTKCGGRVVKNVTGYDLAKLYTGSYGTLGVISAAWLRLHPRPQHVALLQAEFSETSDAVKAALAVSRCTSVRACTLLSPDKAREIGCTHSLAASWVLVAEFAGEEAECRDDAKFFSSLADVHSLEKTSSESSQTSIDRISRLLAKAPDQPCVRGRLACLPSALGAACATLKKSGAHLIVQPGLGLVQAEFRATGTKAPLDTQEMVALLERVSREAKGTLMLEALPPAAGDAYDVFAEEIAAFPIMKELKRQFDPDGVLNPGRFVGNL